MDEQMMRERIRSLEEHTDKLVAQSDALKAQLAERDAEIERLRAQVAELQAWKAAVPVDALRRLHDNTAYSSEYAPSSGYSVTQYDEDCAITDEWLVNT